MTNSSDILYLNELWLKPNEIHHLKELPLENSGKSVLFKSDIDFEYVRGRPFGGQAWLINKNFKLINFEFLNKHLSYIHLKITDREFMVIGTYMPFDDPKERDQSLCSFELILTLIATLLNKAKTLQISTFLVGDFNSDPCRNNRFDKILKLFLDEQSIKSFVFSYPQLTNHTYKSSKTINLFSLT